MSGAIPLLSLRLHNVHRHNTGPMCVTHRDRHAVIALVNMPSSLLGVSRSAPTIGHNLTTHRYLQCHIPVSFLILGLPTFQDVSSGDITCW
jgi:hypothetical protein